MARKKREKHEGFLAALELIEEAVYDVRAETQSHVRDLVKGHVKSGGHLYRVLRLFYERDLDLDAVYHQINKKHRAKKTRLLYRRLAAECASFLDEAMRHRLTQVFKELDSGLPETEYDLDLALDEIGRLVADRNDLSKVTQHMYGWRGMPNALSVFYVLKYYYQYQGNVDSVISRFRRDRERCTDCVAIARQCDRFFRDEHHGATRRSRLKLVFGDLDVERLTKS